MYIIELSRQQAQDQLSQNSVMKDLLELTGVPRIQEILTSSSILTRIKYESEKSYKYLNYLSSESIIDSIGIQNQKL